MSGARPRSAAVLILALGVLVPGAAAQTPKAGSFAGSLGVNVPKGAKGSVRAISRADGTVAAVARANAKGAFRLSAPAGTYLVAGVVASRRGGVVTSRIAMSLKAGQRRTKAKLRVRRRTMPKRRKAKARRSAPARAAYVQEKGQVTPGRVAVEIPPLTGRSRDPEWDAMRGGIDDLLITDVTGAEVTRKCGTTVVEVEHRADAIRELEFQQSAYVDPSTRLERNFIVGDVEVRGAIADGPAAGSLSVTLSVVDKHTGKVLDTLQQTLTPDASWAARMEQLSGKLSDALCKLRDVYEVTVNLAGDANFATHSASGTLRGTLLARRPKGASTWTGEVQLQWAGLSFPTKIGECPLIDPVAPTFTLKATIEDAGGGQLKVTWEPAGRDNASASVDCAPGGPGEPDPPPIPGMAGVAILNTGPTSFTVPYAGGTQALSGNLTQGADGWINTGTMVVKPGGVAASG